jgi:hypothetical protein
LAKITTASQAQIAVSTDRRFQSHKRSQLFIRMHNETLSLVAVGVSNPDPFAPENQRLRHSPNSNRR